MFPNLKREFKSSFEKFLKASTVNLYEIPNCDGEKEKSLIVSDIINNTSWVKQVALMNI